MRYQILNNNPNPKLQNQLEVFETQFHYPLGDEHRFSISHCQHYLNFYLAMGPATCVIAENDEGVQGTICATIRQIYLPETQTTQDVAYVGDLKVSPNYQGSEISYQLMKKLSESHQHSDSPVMCVVMDGTKLTPMHYSGKAGLIALEPLRKIYILQFKAKADPNLDEGEIDSISEQNGMALFRSIYQKPFFAIHQLQLRAKGGYRWLLNNTQSCAILENTRLAKRLYLENGQEIKNAHLSYFAYNQVESSIKLLKHALHLAYQDQYQALFLALTESEYQELSTILEELTLESVATATIYGTKDLQAIPFQINTAEI